MRFIRTAFAALTLAGTMATLQATDVTMADGSIHFSTPDNWVGIMETQGDPEVRVFQVPDPSPTANNALARVTVTVKDVGDSLGYQQYLTATASKAKALTGYKPVTSTNDSHGSSTSLYTAQEGGVPFAYQERYWLKGTHAVQLRCLRPEQSQAGAGWRAEFDRGCEAVAAGLQK